MPGLRVNVGCGSTPTPGWVNFDNSPTLRLPRWLLSGERRAFRDVADRHGVKHADALRLPLADHSVAVLYSSHMLEHLGRRAAARFLAECRRVLEPGGVLRLAVPDLRRLAESYLRNADADVFVAQSLLAAPAVDGMLGRLRSVLAGPRHHLWMYDGHSLCTLVGSFGFVRVRVVPPGETGISEPGALDLSERADESVYVEALAP